jgi:hypothetical protein
MILGLFSLSAYTILHVIISLLGIGTGLVVLFGMIAGQRLNGWTFWFLLTTVLTSLTGFGFPFDRLLPSHILAILSLAALLIAILARYAFAMEGAWRWLYVVAAVLSLWFNVFVLVAQGFGKIPALNALAPTQSEPPFLIAEAVGLAIFVLLAVVAIRKFRPQPAAA